MRIKIDPLFAFIAGLVLGVMFSPLLGAKFAHADTFLIPDENMTLDVGSNYLFTFINPMEVIAPFSGVVTTQLLVASENTQTLVNSYGVGSGVLNSGNGTYNNIGLALGLMQDMPTGTYYFIVAHNSGNSTVDCTITDCYYYPYYWNNTDKTIDTENPTGIVSANRLNQIIAPLPYGTTTATNTVNIKINFKSVAGFDYATLPPQTFGWRVYDAVTNVLEKEYTQSVSTNTAFTLSYSTTTTLTNGSKILRSFIESLNTGVDIEPEDSTFFNVIDNSYFDATGLSSPQDNGSDLTQIDCNTFDVGCQFQKAITFLFAPSQNVLDKFSSIWSRLQYVKPFGYLTNALDNLRGVNNTENEAYTMPEIPFMTEIFQPWNNAMSVILWGIFAFVFYNKRLKNIDI
jgi:hypothetical protein